MVVRQPRESGEAIASWRYVDFGGGRERGQPK